MENDILQKWINFVKSSLNNEDEPTVREQVVQPKLRQPAPEPEQMRLDNIDSYEEPESLMQEDLSEFGYPTLGREDTNFDLGSPEDFDMRTDAEIKEQEYNVYMEEERGVQGIDSDDTKLQSTETQARTTHLEDIKELENGAEVGLEKSATGYVFMPIKSMEGVGPTKSMSDQEIGYGIKIPKKWLSKDKRSWPTIDGVKVDITKGISKDQAESLTKKALNKAYDTASSKLKTWDDMTEKEKSFWADLTYNGGTRAIDKNPKAKAAVNAGYTVEGMIRALDYIKASGKPTRGLLNRRLSMYNQAALEVTGAPIIEEYTFGEEIKVKFSSAIMTDKVSKAFTKKINSNKYWLKIAKGKGDQKSWKVGDNFKFES